MIDQYKIEETSNIEPEQHRAPYTESNFWPEFQKDMQKFKSRLIECEENNIPFSLLRIGHAEFCLLSRNIPHHHQRKGKIITHNILPRHYTGKQNKEDYIDFFESFNNSDYITTQMGYDYKDWVSDIINWRDRYNEYKNKKELDNLFKNFSLFNNSYTNYEFKDLINMPLDIVYGLIANKWILKTFKNKIGLIGNEKKLDIIKNLMEHQKYRDYIHNDFFTDYVCLPQRQAVESGNLKEKIFEKVIESKCKVFLIGAGVAKLKFFNELKNIKNCIYLDVGHGIDAIAGLADYERPYFGSWQNFRLRRYNYRGTDFCGDPSWKKSIIL
tara:strand:- start:358 stop:1338 length:981 start_codon:yes stop_codon:yes gene_type:complete